MCNIPVYSMIEMMEDYTNELEERLSKQNDGAAMLATDSAPNMESVNDKPSHCQITSFTDRKTAVMMMCVDSATAQSGSDWSLVDVVREATMSVSGEVVVAVEAWNLVVVLAVEQNVSASTGTPVARLLAIAGQVITEVGNKRPHRRRTWTIFLINLCIY